MTPRTIGDKHEWAIITGVEVYDCILISLVEGAALLGSDNKATALFKKNAIVTKKGDEYTYDKSDLATSTKSTQ